MASIDVVKAVGTLEHDHHGNPLYKVTDDYISIRLTVNGTNSRFFVPVGGDSNHVPKLELTVSTGHINASTTTTTTSTMTMLTTMTSTTTSTTTTTTTTT